MFVECTTIHGLKKLVPKEKISIRPAAYGIVIYEDKILLLRTKSTGKYWLPGGALELGEKLEEALKREIREEAGIEVTDVKFLNFSELFFYYDPLDLAFQSLSFFYTCVPNKLDLLADGLADPEEESEKPRWVVRSSLTRDQIQVGAEVLYDYLGI